MIRRRGNKKAWALLLVMLALFCVWIPRERAAATSTQGGKLEVIDIDYEKETITVKSTRQDTCLYYSDAKQKTWECAYGPFQEVQKDNKKHWEYVLDISWIKKTKDYVLTLKGDISNTVVSVTLPKQQTNFKVTLDYATGKFDYVNYFDKNVPLYWRKNNSTTWEKVDMTTYATIQRFYAKGVSLYFRLGQVRGESDTKVGSRPTKEVKLAIAKQALAPSVTITPATQVLALPALLQYQVYEDGSLVGGDAASWKTASDKKLSIPKDIAVNAYYSGSNLQTKEVKVVLRTAATAKKPASMEKTITIKAQETYPKNAKVKVASDKALSLEITEILDESVQEGEEKKVLMEGASTSNPYEYTIVAPNEELKLETAVWKAVTVTSTTITKDKAEPGSTIYVRKKAHVASNDKAVYYPESQCYSYKVGNYRDASTVALEGAETDHAYSKQDTEGKTIIMLEKEEGTDAKEDGLKFQIITGVVSDSTPAGDGEATPPEVTTVEVSSILCNNIALEYEAPNADGVIHVTLTSTKNFESAAFGDTSYPLVITLSNGEVLNGSVMLNVLKKAYLKQECLLNVIKGATSNSYTFVVVSTKTFSGTHGSYNLASIESVKLNGKEITSVHQEQDRENGTIKVTLDQVELEKVLTDSDLNKKYALEITVEDSTKTKIDSGVDVIYTEEAARVGAAWSRTKNFSDAFDENLEIKMTYKTPGISISDVMLVNGNDKISIIGNCYVDSEYLYVILSKNKINEINGQTAGMVTGTVYAIKVEFSNHAVVDTGCTMLFRQ